MGHLTATQKASSLNKPLRNQNWYDNDRLIFAAFNELQQKTGKTPSVKEIAEATGLSLMPVYEHLRELRTQELTGTHILRTEKVIDKLYTDAEAGNTKAAKILFQYVIPNDGQIADEGQKNVNIQINLVPIGKRIEIEDAEIVTEENE